MLRLQSSGSVRNRAPSRKGNATNAQTMMSVRPFPPLPPSFHSSYPSAIIFPQMDKTRQDGSGLRTQAHYGALRHDHGQPGRSSQVMRCGRRRDPRPTTKESKLGNVLFFPQASNSYGRQRTKRGGEGVVLFCSFWCVSPMTLFPLFVLGHVFM